MGKNKTEQKPNLFFYNNGAIDGLLTNAPKWCEICWRIKSTSDFYLKKK